MNTADKRIRFGCLKRCKLLAAANNPMSQSCVYFWPAVTHLLWHVHFLLSTHTKKGCAAGPPSSQQVTFENLMSFMVFHGNILSAGVSPSTAQWYTPLSSFRSSHWLCFVTRTLGKIICATWRIKMEPAAQVPRACWSHTCAKKHNTRRLAGGDTQHTPFQSIPFSAINLYLDCIVGVGVVVMWIKLNNPIPYIFQPRQSVRMKCRSQALGKFHAVLSGLPVAPVSFACQCAKAAWGMKSLAARHRWCYFQALWPSCLVCQVFYWKDIGENVFPVKLFFFSLQSNLPSCL